MNPGDSVTDLSEFSCGQGRRLPSALRRPWRVPGEFDGGDTRRVRRAEELDSGENRTIHEGEIVCAREKDGKAENRKEGKRRDEKGRKVVVDKERWHTR